MDAVGALAAVNAELARRRRPPLILSDAQTHRAFDSLRQYAQNTGVSLEQAAIDVVKFQIQSEELEALRRLS